MAPVCTKELTVKKYKYKIVLKMSNETAFMVTRMISFGILDEDYTVARYTVTKMPKTAMGGENTCNHSVSRRIG